MVARKTTNPGDVLIETWNCTKGRPWLVLWVDEQAEEVCVAASTSQRDYCGVIETGHAEFATIGAWVMIQPLHKANAARKVGHMNDEQRSRVAAALHRNLAILAD